MASRKETDCDFALKGLRFSYQRNFKAFICDPSDMLAILRKNYPDNYKAVVAKHPEIVSAGSERPKRGEPRSQRPLPDLAAWKEPDIKESKDESAQVRDGKDAEEGKTAGGKGMISRLSKGIRKIIATITPTKLRKRWHLEDEEPANAHNSPITTATTQVTEPSLPIVAPIPPPPAEPAAGKS
ncbi:MAG: hypothetical protein P4L10_14490 [Acidobacteriaceae bacterium]|nr:hypothetical protein [Acidobacteriaceae bacterium]